MSDEATSALFDHPTLVVDPGMHTAPMRGLCIDSTGQWAATASDDKTVRIWSVTNGALLETIRLPAGPGHIGMAYAAAFCPGGDVIAVGGWTRIRADDLNEQIYFFDWRKGLLRQRIEGLPNTVHYLEFSPDGQRLVATMDSGGMRVFAAGEQWSEIARDEDYGGASHGAAFASDGSLVTTSYDGGVRLYPADLKNTVQPTVTILTSPKAWPHGVAVSPDGAHFVVGYAGIPLVSIHHGNTLGPAHIPDLKGVGNGTLATVAWSRDGKAIFAGGQHQLELGVCPVLVWEDGGAGVRRALPAGHSSVLRIVPLADGDILVGEAAPQLIRLDPAGKTRWAHVAQNADLRDQKEVWAVSADGATVDFAFEQFGQSPARFDLANRKLTLGALPDAKTAPARQEGLPISGWKNGFAPTFGAQPIALERNERSRSLAIQPTNGGFVLGSDRRLRAFDAKGAPLWQRQVPGTVWEVAVSGDGRLVVAGYSDGTIRWHRMDNGVELAAFMPLADRQNWVAWTPQGYYAATPAARTVLCWRNNRGWDAPAETVPIDDVLGSYRPDALPLVLQELDIWRALGRADDIAHTKSLMMRTGSRFPPGARLYALAVGVNVYNFQHAKSLRLHYAVEDATDFANALVGTQSGFYAVVSQKVLSNQDASKPGILSALNVMRSAMQQGGADNLAIFHFSGHGGRIDGKLYLLPYDVDARSIEGVKSSALSIDELRLEFIELAKLGRVLVLLDACHSGGMTMDEAPLVMNSTALRVALASANVTVLTSSKEAEVSRECVDWGHGAFTKVLIEALQDPDADKSHNGLISMNAFADYVAERVPWLTQDAQNPDQDVRFSGTIFASGA